MGLYKFDERNFDSRYWGNIQKIVGKHRNGNVVFVDVDEAKLETNRKRGLTKAGWWYLEKVYRNGKPEYRRELLCAASRAIIKERPPRNVNESQDDLVADVMYDSDNDVYVGNYKLYFAEDSPTDVKVWANEYMYSSNSPTTLDYSYKLLNLSENNEATATSLATIINDGASASSNIVRYYVNFQERAESKNSNVRSKSWNTFVPKGNPDPLPNDFNPEHPRNVLTYAPTVKDIFDAHTLEDRNNYRHFYRAILSNNIASLEVTSGEIELIIDDFTIDYNLERYDPEVIQSGELFTDRALNYTYSVVGTGNASLTIRWQTSIDGENWAQLGTDASVSVTKVSEHDFANSGSFRFVSPTNTYFKLSENNLYYRLGIIDSTTSEHFIKEIRQLKVIKRKGYFATNLLDNVSVTPTTIDNTQWMVFDIDVKNDINRDESIGGTNADYALVTKWQYRENEDSEWSNFAANRTLGTSTSATAAVGTDNTKAAVVFNRNSGFQIRVSAQAGTDLDETDVVYSNITTINIDHLIDIDTQPDATAAITSTRGAVTSVSASVAFGTLTYQWQLSNNESEWIDISRSGTNSTTDTLSLSVADVDAIVSGSPNFVYARVNISGATYASDISSNPIKLTVTR